MFVTSVTVNIPASYLEGLKPDSFFRRPSILSEVVLATTKQPIPHYTLPLPCSVL
jgi:hypothetical protein